MSQIIDGNTITRFCSQASMHKIEVPSGTTSVVLKSTCPFLLSSTETLFPINFSNSKIVWNFSSPVSGATSTGLDPMLDYAFTVNGVEYSIIGSAVQTVNDLFSALAMFNIGSISLQDDHGEIENATATDIVKIELFVDGDSEHSFEPYSDGTLWTSMSIFDSSELLPYEEIGPKAFGEMIYAFGSTTLESPPETLYVAALSDGFVTATFSNV